MDAILVLISAILVLIYAMKFFFHSKHALTVSAQGTKHAYFFGNGHVGGGGGGCRDVVRGGENGMGLHQESESGGGSRHVSDSASVFGDAGGYGVGGVWVWSFDVVVS